MLEYIGKESLQALVNDQTVEHRSLEFKSYLFPNGKIEPSKVKEELAKDITAMANAEGGVIILGIREIDNVAAELIGIGCSMAAFDEIQQALQSFLLARVRPRLYGIAMAPIILDNDNISIVISIPRSFARPHAVNDGNKDYFFIRHGNIVQSMSVDELRRQFLLSSSLKTEIKLFRQDRIGMVINHETVGPLLAGPKLIIHMIPAWSFEDSNFVNVRQFQEEAQSNLTNPISRGSSWGSCYNADGYCEKHETKSNEVDYYFQIFRNGIIEIVDSCMLLRLSTSCEYDYRWSYAEAEIFRKLQSNEKLLTSLCVPRPWYIFISLLNMKGFRANTYGESRPLDRDIIHADSCLWEDDIQNLDHIIRPAFDSLANCFGRASSANFYDDGRYKHSS